MYIHDTLFVILAMNQFIIIKNNFSIIYNLMENKTILPEETSAYWKFSYNFASRNKF